MLADFTPLSVAGLQSTTHCSLFNPALLLLNHSVLFFPRTHTHAHTHAHTQLISSPPPFHISAVNKHTGFRSVGWMTKRRTVAQRLSTIFCDPCTCALMMLYPSALVMRSLKSENWLDCVSAQPRATSCHIRVSPSADRHGPHINQP